MLMKRHRGPNPGQFHGRRRMGKSGAPHRQRDSTMADHQLKDAHETYAGMLSWFKIGTIAAALIALLVIILIS